MPQFGQSENGKKPTPRYGKQPEAEDHYFIGKPESIPATTTSLPHTKLAVTQTHKSGLRIAD